MTSYIVDYTNIFMVTKLKYNNEELDIPRGINLPQVGESIELKMNGKVINYNVVSIVHELDYDVAIKTGKTIINLEQEKKVKAKSKES